MTRMERHTNDKDRKEVATATGAKASISPLSFLTVLLTVALAQGMTTQRLCTRIPGSTRIVGDPFLLSSRSMPMRIPSESLTTKLLYAHGDSEDNDDRRGEHRAAVNGLGRLSSWLSNLRGSTVDSKESEQQVVDEYLEFLDRRYHRLHSEMEAPAPVKQFSAWDWLVDNKGKDSSLADAKKNHDDALFVLGVAELASERLLQKHHIPVESVATKEVIETKAYPVVAEKETSGGLFGAAPAASSVLQKVSARRRALILYQEKQLKTLATKTVQAALRFPSKVASTVKAVWQHGGGKKTTALALSVLTTVFLLLRPLLAAASVVVFESGFREG